MKVPRKRNAIAISLGVALFPINIIASDYVAHPSEFSLTDAVKNWTVKDITIDEEFYISRVSPKPLLPLSTCSPNRIVWMPAGDKDGILPSTRF